MSAIKLMKKEEEVDVPVTWEDQSSINTFARLNNKLTDLEIEYAGLTKEKEYLDDLKTEMELFDEDEPVRYKIGDSFVQIPFDEASERLDKEVTKSNKKMQDLKKEMADINSKMDKLKVILYAKFGKAINLDR